MTNEEADSRGLPLATYHRTKQLGEGSFGSVVTVYNDDGEEFALKLFLLDDDHNNDNDDDDDDDNPVKPPLDIGVLREISCLRLLREYQHPNILRMHDIQSSWTDEEENEGAGTAGCLGMAMPLYRAGSLAHAIERKTLDGYPRRVKVQVAHDILSAIQFLHANGILHRDIKPDNVLLDFDGEESVRAVLIDFSLAKPIDDTIFRGGPTTPALDLYEKTGHTGEVGTMVYTAPEVLDEETGYGTAVDIWSVGVVLLELLTNQFIAATKPKQILQAISTAKEALPRDQPFPELVRALLQIDPVDRPTAHQALEHMLFVEKFNLPVPAVQYLHVGAALPYDDPASLGEENAPPNQANLQKRRNHQTKRMATVERICLALGSRLSITRQAAMEYSQQLEQLDDCLDDIDSSQGLIDCVVLAHRVFEVEAPSLRKLDATHTGVFASWNLSDYVDNESTIFMIMDYCLYPRNPSLR